LLSFNGWVLVTEFELLTLKYLVQVVKFELLSFIAQNTKRSDKNRECVQLIGNLKNGGKFCIDRKLSDSSISFQD
jgi:hypothetical protein